jgi:DNA polymerase sigma
MTTSIDQFRRLCHGLNFAKLEDCFVPVVMIEGKCSLCSDSIHDTTATMYCHMHLLYPTGSLWVHGSGDDIESANLSAVNAAIALMTKFEPDIMNLKRARLRVRLEDLGFSLPPRSGGFRGVFDGDTEDMESLPLVYREWAECMSSDDGIYEASHALFLAIGSMAPVTVSAIFCHMALNLIDEMNAHFNEFVWGAVYLLFLRIPSMQLSGSNPSPESEKLRLSFLKLSEQILVYRASEIPNGSKLTSRLIRHFLSQRLVPFMAKNRMDALAVQLAGPAGSGLMKVYEGELNSYEKEDTAMLLSIVQSKTPSKEYLDSLVFEFEKVNSVIKSVFGVPGNIYGSLINGFPTNASDVDVVINLPEYIRGEIEPLEDAADPKSLEALNKLYDALLLELPEFSFSKIESARVPILTAKRNNIEIDVSFNHEVVVLNSELLAAYSSLSDKVRQLVVLIKFWAKQRDVNDSLQGTLSSYSYVLLVIHYLQQIKCLPNLQRPDKSVWPSEIPTRLSDHGKCSTWYLENPEKSQFPSEVARLESLSLKRLLIGFFEYYTWEFNFVNQIVRIDDLEILDKQKVFSKIESSDSLLRRRTWLAIVDPFEINRVLGTTARGSELIVKEMRRGVEMILDGKVSELFEEFKRKEKPVGVPIPLRQLADNDPFHLPSRVEPFFLSNEKHCAVVLAVINSVIDKKVTIGQLEILFALHGYVGVIDHPVIGICEVSRGSLESMKQKISQQARHPAPQVHSQGPHAYKAGPHPPSHKPGPRPPAHKQGPLPHPPSHKPGPHRHPPLHKSGPVTHPPSHKQGPQPHPPSQNPHPHAPSPRPPPPPPSHKAAPSKASSEAPPPAKKSHHKPSWKKNSPQIGTVGNLP